jgi:hypothetical protein
MTKQETSSPTVATEALLLSCVINAVKERDVATCDIPGAFMQSDMKGKVVMKLEGVMAEVIIKIDPKKIHQICRKRKRQGRDLRHTHQGTVRHPTGRPALLAEPLWEAQEMGIRNQPL